MLRLWIRIGMSDEEEGEGDAGSRSETKMEFFVPRRSVKKLQLKSVSLDTTIGGEEKGPTTGAEQVSSLSPSADDEEGIVSGIPESRPSGLATELRNREELDDSLNVLIRRPIAALLNSSVALDRSGKFRFYPIPVELLITICPTAQFTLWNMKYCSMSDFIYQLLKLE